MSRAVRYARSTARWLAAGRPVRSDGAVQELLAICQACQHFQGNTCAVCGCKINTAGGWTNKLRRATEACPIGKWGTNMLTRDEIIRVIDVQWRMRHGILPLNGGDRNKLAVLLGQIGCRVGVEVGTHKGEYAEVLCRAIPELQLTCIDPWIQKNGISQERRNGYYVEAQRRLGPYGVRLLRMTSLAGLDQIPDGSLDFVYIDGDHTFDHVMLDIIHWSRKVRRGGIVAGHDYWRYPKMGVMQAVDAYTYAHSISPWWVTKEKEPSFFWIRP